MVQKPRRLVCTQEKCSISFGTIEHIAGAAQPRRRIFLKSDSGNDVMKLHMFCVETLGDFLLIHLQLRMLEWTEAHRVHTWKKDLEFNFRHCVPEHGVLCPANLGKSPLPAGSSSLSVAPPDCCAGAQSLGQVMDKMISEVHWELL